MKSSSLFDSFKHAFEGVFSAFKEERNMKIHIFCTFAVIVLGTILKLQVWEWIVCIGWICAVVAGELINTAIESVVDMVMPDFHPLAKVAKDVSAGAVVVLAIGAAISGTLIFLPKLLSVISLM